MLGTELFCSTELQAAALPTTLLAVSSSCNCSDGLTEHVGCVCRVSLGGDRGQERSQESGLAREL